MEAPKGPSLKEIQEAEAKKAAKLEEAAAAARRALLEQELRNQPVAPAPALPTTATWANSNSPGPVANVPSAWAKPAPKSQVASSAITTNKKTLADIQKEEELRKQKLAAANAATAMPGQSTVSTGKRYADLAGKPTTGPASSAAWSTVGAGGKVKAPASSAAPTASTAGRTATTTSVPTAPALKAARPAATAARITTGSNLTGQSGVTAAHQEFNKWARTALSKGLNSDINGKSQ
jgi:PERQ amino acid-rich with GYF domain-containing protein